MRSYLFAFALVILGSASVFAASGVLLPSTDSSSGQTGSNLGLVPATQAPASKSTTTTTQQSTSLPSASGDSTSIPANLNPSTYATQPIPPQMADKLKAMGFNSQQQPQPLTGPALQLQQWAATREAEMMQAPPHLMADSPAIRMPDSYLASLPQAMTLSLAASNGLGANDLTAIGRALGYDTGHVQANCQLRFDVMASGDSTFLDRLVSGQQTVIKYKGTLQSVMLRPVAICNRPATLPQNGSLLMITSASTYGVRLTNNVTCSPPATPAQSLQVQYIGDGQASCQFR